MVEWIYIDKKYSTLLLPFEIVDTKSRHKLFQIKTFSSCAHAKLLLPTFARLRRFDDKQTSHFVFWQTYFFVFLLLHHPAYICAQEQRHHIIIYAFERPTIRRAHTHTPSFAEWEIIIMWFSAVVSQSNPSHKEYHLYCYEEFKIWELK